MNRRSGAALAVIVLAVALAAGCSSSSNNGYGGMPTNPGGGTKELNSGDIASGGQYQHRFASPGTFNYHCVHHAPMVGSVIVDVGAPDTLVNLSITSSTAPFPAATVKLGGRVVWTNNNGMTHTVTSN